MYDLSHVLAVDGLTAVRPGSTILVSGPAMSGKDALVREILADGVRNRQGAIAVTTDSDGLDWIADIEATASDFPGYSVAAIDSGGDRGRSERELDNGSFHYSVADPSDLTGIGIGVTKCFTRLQDAGVTEARLGLTSLSTMLTYTDRQTTFKFCHVLSSRLGSAEFVGVFTIDSAAHDDQTMQVIKQAFDGQIELRESNGVSEARLRGLDAGTTDWTEI
jgi:KaiC/GvpD/RAD55 family RecA-like ATPase